MESTDLIRFEGEGNSVVLRITGKEQGPPDMLVGEIVVDASFVRGSTRVVVSAEDLREWREALDTLDVGDGYVSWREGSGEPEVFLERDVTSEQVDITVKYGTNAVTVTVPLTDAWFDDAYDRLDQMWKTWDPA